MAITWMRFGLFWIRERRIGLDAHRPIRGAGLEVGQIVLRHGVGDLRRRAFHVTLPDRARASTARFSRFSVSISRCSSGGSALQRRDFRVQLALALA